MVGVWLTDLDLTGFDLSIVAQLAYLTSRDCVYLWQGGRCGSRPLRSVWAKVVSEDWYEYSRVTSALALTLPPKEDFDLIWLYSSGAVPKSVPYKPCFLTFISDSNSNSFK